MLFSSDDSIFLRVLTNFFLTSTDGSVSSVSGDIGYSDWARWSPCSQTCGYESVKQRQRECIKNCGTGPQIDIRNCGYKPCPSMYVFL